MVIRQLYNLSLPLVAMINDTNFSSEDFDKFSEIIMNRKNVENALSFFILLQELAEPEDKIVINLVHIKKFFSLYLLLFYPEINNVNTKVDVCKNLVSMCKQLKFSFKNILLFTQSLKDINTEDNRFKLGFLPCIKTFFTKFQQYLELFDSWKRVDAEHIIFNLCFNYYNLEVGIQKKEGDIHFTEYRDFFNLEKRKIKLHVNEIDPDEGIYKFDEYLEIIREYKTDMELNEKQREDFFVSRISNAMSYNVKQAYWDVLEEEIFQGNYRKLEKSISELRELIKSCVPNKKEIHVELDEYLEEKYIIQKMEKNVFTKEELYNLIFYIIGKLEKFQSAYEDAFTEEFKEELEDLFLLEETSNNISFTIRFFLENAFPKFTTILKERELFMAIMNKKI